LRNGADDRGGAYRFLTAAGPQCAGPATWCVQKARRRKDGNLPRLT
jgi:hypothetical protein